MSEWDNIQGLDGWKMKLAELLREAETVAQKAEIEPRLALNARLTEFIINSSPNTPEITALDDIAEKARAGLMRSAIEERLEAISAGTGELARLTKEFLARAASAEASAASIRLERARHVVDSLTESVRAVKEFRDALGSGKDEELAKSLDRIVTSMQNLRGEIESRS